MKTEISSSVFAVALLAVAVPAGLHAQAVSPVDPSGLRQFGMDLYTREAMEAGERAAARERAVRLSAATYDLNHDGKLDAAEFAAWEKQVRAVAEETPRVLAKFDRNHDGKLDDGEWAVARKEIIPG